MIKLYLIFGYLFLMSCHHTVPKGYSLINGKYHNFSKTECFDTYEKIKKLWAHNSKYEDCYLFDKKIINLINREKDCFIGLSIAEIEELFGIRSENGISIGNDIRYFISDNCPYKWYIKKRNLILKFSYDKSFGVHDVYIGRDAILD